MSCSRNPLRRKDKAKKTSQPATATNTTASTSDNERTRTNSGAETSAKEYAPKRGHKESKKDTAAEVGGSDEPDDVMSVDGQSSHDIEAGDAGQSAIFSGKFDIYAMGLAFLSSVYLPKGVSQPQYEDLYKTILTYQAESDFSGQCAIPDLSDQTSGSGSFLSVAFADPFSDKPYDIAIKDMESVDSVSYTAAQQGKKFGTPTMGIPGVYASLSLRDSGCGIQSSKGEFRMSRVWTKNDNGKLIELFEGVMNLPINYGSWECNGGIFCLLGRASQERYGRKGNRARLWLTTVTKVSRCTIVTVEDMLGYDDDSKDYHYNCRHGGGGIVIFGELVWRLFNCKLSAEFGRYVSRAMNVGGDGLFTKAEHGAAKDILEVKLWRPSFAVLQTQKDETDVELPFELTKAQLESAEQRSMSAKTKALVRLFYPNWGILLSL
ncbi:hypothetical protein BDP27DRAFT_1364522 [Rhodocollybia butyracea]|uniref:Uncharacterized protein n=1 Tax=Rhodocollybia butyracea TaxID=206335 RepID=A0A9P5PR34_9AGAR|nr:hypothetical protein BDP27DRAFT_1364522 [Rhodocollybia butyracea]